MRWDETIANRCRYGDVAGEIWGDWEIIWEDSHDGYQGEVSFFAVDGAKCCFYEWSYGTCSGCDDWEGRNLSDAQIEQEMRGDALWFEAESDVRIWLEMLEWRNVKSEMVHAIETYFATRGG